MSDRTIKIEKIATGYAFVNGIVGRKPDNIDLYTLYFVLMEFEKGTAMEAQINVLKKFAKRYKTKVVIR